MPDGWCWARVGTISNIMSGTTYPSNLECSNGEFLYVKVGDMNLPDNNFEITTSRQYIKDVSLSHLVPVGSIIFPKRGGAIQTNKKKLVLQKEIFCNISPLRDLRLISYWASGQREFSFDMLIKIADLFSVSVDYLLVRSDYYFIIN